mmetsp:Transcript_21129/g.51702  ORF Transcript_21129/g.51702 Transcript_21129/m.51702 type:complete len:204 (-) Transcript_21129:149-760(-)
MVVYGFLLHGTAPETGSSKPPPTSASASEGKDKKQSSSGEIVVWACRFYDKEGNNKLSCIRAKAVASRVKQEFFVSRDDENTTHQSSELQSRMNARGVFRLPPSKLFSRPKTVHWLSRSRALCTLICEERTNVLLAASQLELLVEGISKHFGPNAFLSPKIVNEKPEELYMLLDRILPCGNLQFLSEVDIKRELAELAALTSG